MGNEADNTVMLIIGVFLGIGGGVALLWLALDMLKNKFVEPKKVMIAIVALALLIGGVLIFFNYFGRDDQAIFEASLVKQAVEMNKTLPRMLDKNTRFDEVTVFGTEVHYRHTVVTYSAEELDNDEFQRIMIDKLMNAQCRNPDLTELLRRGVKYRYNYFGNQGRLISTVLISKETCRIR